MRRCIKCHIEKPIGEFFPTARKCISCHEKRDPDTKRSTEQKRRAKFERILKGITRAQNARKG